MRYPFQGFAYPARLHGGEVCMRELREAEKLRLLQSKIQVIYEKVEIFSSDGMVTVDSRGRW